jgi:hypothetical protein
MEQENHHQNFCLQQAPQQSATIAEQYTASRGGLFNNNCGIGDWFCHTASKGGCRGQRKRSGECDFFHVFSQNTNL